MSILVKKMPLLGGNIGHIFVSLMQDTAQKCMFISLFLFLHAAVRCSKTCLWFLSATVREAFVVDSSDKFAEFLCKTDSTHSKVVLL